MLKFAYVELDQNNLCPKITYLMKLYFTDLICIQETKMAQIPVATIRSTLAREYDSGYVYLPAIGTSGGILLAALRSHTSAPEPYDHNHTISVKVVDCRYNMDWQVTGVYGPRVILRRNCSFVN
jgi:exonuclease III